MTDLERGATVFGEIISGLVAAGRSDDARAMLRFIWSDLEETHQ